ncbi:Eukaryotic translation initiation factor 5B [Cucumispora dikerogammari]|nr:Eukaryotic translation initiation factor 5B [Cucumispora dikerogammari]
MSMKKKNKNDDFFDCFDTTRTVDDIERQKSNKKKKNISKTKDKINEDMVKEFDNNMEETSFQLPDSSDITTRAGNQISTNEQITELMSQDLLQSNITGNLKNDKETNELQDKLQNFSITDIQKKGEDKKEFEKSKLINSLRMFPKKPLAKKPIQKNILKNIVEEEGDGLTKSIICCILGHVDTGKTKILDKLRQTDIQGNEAGGITQQIGATFFPRSLLKRKSPNLKTKLPGILIIDTPGHETFSNLRSRGSSLCNIAILVVDILHGLEPQTLESIELLKKGKTYFIIALNKIDRILGWVPHNDEDFRSTLGKQTISTQREFQNLAKNAVLRFSEIGLNVSLFYQNPNEKQFLNLVPTSAITGEGLADLIDNIVYSSEKFFKKKLMYKDDFECTLLECVSLEGYGNTVDVILSNGELKIGDKIVLCSLNGPIITTVKHILVPEPRIIEKKICSKIPLKKKKSIKAAAGLKIVANDLENVVAGTKILKMLQNEKEGLEIEKIKKEVMADYKLLLSKTSETGVHIQSSTLGSLEALIVFVESKNIPIASVGVGNLTKTSILKSALIKEKGYVFGGILCFNIKVDKDLEELAKQKNLKIFKSEIIYNLIDEYKEHVVLIKARNKKIHKVVYPFQLMIIPAFIFTKRSPLIFGVEIKRGKLAINSRVFVKTSEIIKLGTVTSIEKDKQPVILANKGDKVAIKIENAESPKIIGRHFKETDLLESFIDKSNILLLKTTFNDDMSEDDWALILELQQKLGIF